MIPGQIWQMKLIVLGLFSRGSGGDFCHRSQHVSVPPKFYIYSLLQPSGLISSPNHHSIGPLSPPLLRSHIPITTTTARLGSLRICLTHLCVLSASTGLVHSRYLLNVLGGGGMSAAVCKCPQYFPFTLPCIVCTYLGLECKYLLHRHIFTPLLSAYCCSHRICLFQQSSSFLQLCLIKALGWGEFCFGFGFWLFFF